MEKEPKKSAAESTSRQAETSDREPEAGSSPCESPEPHPGILREIGKEAREQVRPNQGYLKIDYFTLFWLFVAGSVFGLVVETVFHAIVYGGYESRAGLVWGPFSPIYGVGAVALTVSLNRFYHSHNLIIFLIAMLLGSVMEYATSWLMEVLWGAIAWDYTGTFGSINGRTNFAFGVMWGLLGLVWVRTILPFIKRVFSHVDARSMLARLVTAALSLFMALFFMSGRKNLRANDRFTVEFPAEVDYHGKKYYGVTGDASETGLSLIFSQSAYLPHEKGEEMEIRLKTERYEAVVKGTAVQVSKQEDGSWRYGVKLSELDEENKASYFQMLYDRDHSLAKQMGKSVSIFEDVFLNIHRRAERGTQSRRALPRVDLGLELPTVTGGKVRIVDCNYEFARLEAVDAILLPYEQVKAPGGVMICRQVEGKAGLYQIENWQELLFNGVFDTLFAQADYALPEEKEPAPAKS